MSRCLYVAAGVVLLAYLASNPQVQKTSLDMLRDAKTGISNISDTLSRDSQKMAAEQQATLRENAAIDSRIHRLSIQQLEEMIKSEKIIIDYRGSFAVNSANGRAEISEYNIRHGRNSFKAFRRKYPDSNNEELFGKQTEGLYGSFFIRSADGYIEGYISSSIELADRIGRGSGRYCIRELPSDINGFLEKFRGSEKSISPSDGWRELYQELKI